MRGAIPAFAFAAALTLSACDEDTANLAAAQSAAAAGEITVTADTELTCPPSDSACAKNFWIKADSCLRLAQNEIRSGRASGAEAAARTSCALDNYAKALRGWSDPAGTARASNLEALRVSRQIARSSSAGQTSNASLAEAASRFSQQFPSLNAGPYYVGDAVFYDAVQSGASDCAALLQAAGLAEAAAGARAVPDTPSLRSAIATLDRQSKAAAQSAGCG